MAVKGKPKIVKFLALAILLVVTLGISTGVYFMGEGIMRGMAAKSGKMVEPGPGMNVMMFAVVQLIGIGLFTLVIGLFGKASKRAYIQVVCFALIIAMGIGISKNLAAMKKRPEQNKREPAAPLFTALKVSVEDMQMLVQSTGTVQPKIEVDVTAQVSGIVENCHENFVNGGFFEAFKPLVTIDRRDYEVALENARSAVAAAEVGVAREEAEAIVAKEEWYQLHPESEPTSSLVLRVPQIKKAKADLKAAQAREMRALLDLARTEIMLPFNGRISRKNVDVGQLVGPGQPIATVYSTDAVEIIVPLEDRELKWFDVPMGQTNDDGDGVDFEFADVDITAEFAGAEYTWCGKAVRTHGRVDPLTRMVNVVVEVEDPFKVEGDKPPLMPGMFIKNVTIKGKMLSKVVRIPASAVHGADEIWISNDEQLHIRKVEIARRDDKYAYVSSGLEEGDVLITSPYDSPIDGMKIRTQEEDSEMADGGKDK